MVLTVSDRPHKRAPDWQNLWQTIFKPSN